MCLIACAKTFDTDINSILSNILSCSRCIVYVTITFDSIELDKWLGPFRSAFGHHIIYVTNYQEGFYPDINKVLKKVEVDFMLYQKDMALEKYLNEIKSEYKIYINPDLQI